MLAKVYMLYKLNTILLLFLFIFLSIYIIIWVVWSDGMSICDQIKPPFETYDDLIKLIGCYAEIKNDHYGFLYSKLVSEEDNVNSYEKYIELFKKYISNFYYNKLWSYLKGLNPKIPFNKIAKIITRNITIFRN